MRSSKTAFRCDYCGKEGDVSQCHFCHKWFCSSHISARSHHCKVRETERVSGKNGKRKDAREQWK